MRTERSLRDVLRNTLQYSDLPFRDFVEMALYHPESGYYSGERSPAGQHGDFITAPLLSPLFADVLGNLVHEFLRRTDDGLSQVVDIGCGDGVLIRAFAANVAERDAGDEAGRRSTPPAFFGVDRQLGRAVADLRVTYRTSLAEIPPADARLIISNELFDAFPFARLVQRGEHLHELWVTERDGALDWSEHEADGRYEDYFAERGVTLDDGQFVDVSLEWAAFYEELCRSLGRGMIVTFDYGLPQARLFRGRMRRFGTAAAYSGHRVNRDLLADPGRQDLTAHINFDDLIATGEKNGLATLFFDIQSKFLLAEGAADHPLLTPIGDAGIRDIEEGLAWLDARENAKRLILPDGIGADIRVLVQARGMGEEAWRFQKKLF